MMPLRFVRFEIRKPRYDPHPEKSKTNNSKWRQGLFVIFKDYQGNEYDWMPKWEHLAGLTDKKHEVEMLNKQLCKEFIQNGGVKDGGKGEVSECCVGRA